MDLARAAGVLIERVPREAFTRLVGPDVNHQGVAAAAASADYVPVDELLDGIQGPALLVILDGVEDPRNLGAVLRTGECSGADGVVIPERRAVGLTDTVAKSSAGAIEYVKVAKTPNLNRVIEDLKERNIWVVGTSGDAATSYTDWDWKQPSALVLGAEGSGLHRLVRENCDVLVKIPMYGKIDSLNVSVAAGVVLFEAKRQRGGESTMFFSKCGTQNPTTKILPELRHRPGRVLLLLSGDLKFKSRFGISCSISDENKDGSNELFADSIRNIIFGFGFRSSRRTPDN